MSRTREDNLPVEIRGFGGLVLNEGFSENIEDNELTELVNFDITDGKTLKKRNGWEKRTNGPQASRAIVLLGQFNPLDSNDNDILVCTPTDFKTSDGNITASATAGGSADWTTIQDPTGPADEFILAWPGFMYNNSLYVPTDEGIKRYDGTSPWTEIATATFPCSTLTQVLDRGFANTFNDRDRIYYSNPGDLNTWDSTDQFIDISQGDGEWIVSLVGYKDRLVIFKENSIWILYLTGSPVNWSLRKYITGLGCSSVFGTVLVDDNIYFTARDGIYRTNLSTLEDISQPIKSVFKNRSEPLSGTSVVYTQGFSDSAGYWNGRIVFQISVDNEDFNSSDTRLFVYYNRTEQWSEWIPSSISSGDPYNAFINFLSVHLTHDDTSPTTVDIPEGLYAGSREANNKLFRFSDGENATTFQDDGNNFECRFITKEYTFEDAAEHKKIPYMAIAYGGDADTVATVTHTVDGSAQSPITIGGFATTPTVVKTSKHKGPGYFRKFTSKYIFTNTSDQSGVEVRSLTMYTRFKALLSKNR